MRSAPEITIIRPDDWHLHVRDGEALKSVVPDTARRFARAIIMPNLPEPITTVERAAAYRDRILAAVPEGVHFEPLMVLYLTAQMTEEEIRKAAASGFVKAVKWYPAGATTNSDKGVKDIAGSYSILKVMEEVGLKFLVHGEVTDENVDIFDREAVFIERYMRKIVADFPNLKIVFEHVTTLEAVEFVKSASDNVAATITPQHLLYNRNAILAGGLKPHFYCLPVLKREKHRLALVKAATSGNPKFFLGTDSAPHAKGAKETSCGCAGIYSAHIATELYAEVFEAEGCLENLEKFASINGANFYGLAINEEKITLKPTDTKIPKEIKFGSDVLVPFRAGGRVMWTLE
jgi:dihydroorotase